MSRGRGREETPCGFDGRVSPEGFIRDVVTGRAVRTLA